MDSSTIPAEVRRDRILNLIEAQGFVRVAELGAKFGVSDVTIRSDLDFLARVSLIERVHGGAKLPGPSSLVVASPAEREPSFEESVDTYASDKAAIGRAAAALVSNGDSIVIDVGTTADALARALVARSDLSDVVVFTSGIPIAMRLEPAIPRFTVVVTGGTLRPKQHSLVNPMGLSILDQINVDTAFIGCNGINATEGVTNINLPEAQIKRHMIHAARRVVVIADGTKIGRASVARLAHIGEVDRLITSDSAPSEALDEFRELGVEVTVAR
jgi:DeoR family transcriptional regulator of aga operon